MQVETGPPINTSIDDPDNQRFKEDDFRMLYMKVWTVPQLTAAPRGYDLYSTGMYPGCDAREEQACISEVQGEAGGHLVERQGRPRSGAGAV